MKPSDFYTRPQANTPQKMILPLPNGQPSEHCLMVLGTESDQFQRAKLEAHRRAMEAKAGEHQDHEFSNNERIRMIASVVVGWSFETAYSEDAVMDLLRQAPYIADAVDRYSSRRANFTQANS